ncbi:MAG: gliding motility-associated C-terminal domain-containing protein [Chitinophagales bacterium]
MRRIFSALLISCSSLLTLAQTSISGVINTYSAVTFTDFCNNNAIVESAIGFSAGDKVLLIQMTGANMDLAETASYGTITDYNTTGNYEILTIGTISFNIITFTEAMEKTYDAINGRVQLVRIPQYTDVDIDGVVTATPWTGTKGGIVAFFASGTVTFNNNIDVSWQGFKGGDDFSHTLCWSTTGNFSGYACTEADYCGSRKGESIGVYLTDSLGRGAPANGGGGGNDSNTGGGGGANYGAGGVGGERYSVPSAECPGDFPGYGGHALLYSNAENRIFMGGGGGSGDQNDNDGTPGSPGGGIVLIQANAIDGNGFAIKANGKPVFAIASNDAAGGGGGAGTVILDVASITSTLNVELVGGDGGDVDNDFDATNCHGPGGGGGGGTLWVSGGSLPVNLSYNAAGGPAGITINPDAPSACNGSSNGAAAGSPGGTLTDLVLPMPSVIFVPLTLTIEPTQDTILCEGESLNIDAIATGTGTLDYLWSDGSTSTSVFVTPTGEVTYQVTVSDDRGCQITKTIDADIIENVEVSAYPDSVIAQGNFVTLFTNLDPTFDYSWSPVDETIDDPTNSTPTVHPLTTTTYCVTVTDQVSGCVSEDCLLIEVIADVAIPNVFSPNGDGVNDIFRIPNLGDLCEAITFFKIYTRWGDEVYDYFLDPLQTGWTGIDQQTGIPQNVGTYMYVIKLDCVSEERIFKNDVLLLR